MYGLSENGSAPAGALLSDLKPKLFRAGGAGLSGGAWAVGGLSGYQVRFNSVLAQYNRANSIGAKFQILVSDMWGSDERFPTTISRYSRETMETGPHGIIFWLSWLMISSQTI